MIELIDCNSGGVNMYDLFEIVACLAIIPGVIVSIFLLIYAFESKHN